VWAGGGGLQGRRFRTCPAMVLLSGGSLLPGHAVACRRCVRRPSGLHSQIPGHEDLRIVADTGTDSSNHQSTPPPCAGLHASDGLSRPAVRLRQRVARPAPGIPAPPPPAPQSRAGSAWRSRGAGRAVVAERRHDPRTRPADLVRLDAPRLQRRSPQSLSESIPPSLPQQELSSRFEASRGSRLTAHTHDCARRQSERASRRPVPTATPDGLRCEAWSGARGRLRAIPRRRPRGAVRASIGVHIDLARVPRLTSLVHGSEPQRRRGWLPKARPRARIRESGGPARRSPRIMQASVTESQAF